MNGNRPTPYVVCIASLLFGAFAALPVLAADSGSIRDAIVTTAESFLGVSYVYGGDTANGFDCSGLVYRVYREAADKIVPRTTDAEFKDGVELRSPQVQPGDLVFFDTEGSGVSHVGIYIGDGKFVHAASEGPTTGVIVSSFSYDYYRTRYVGARAFLPVSGVTTAGAASDASQPGAASVALAASSAGTVGDAGASPSLVSLTSSSVTPSTSSPAATSPKPGASPSSAGSAPPFLTVGDGSDRSPAGAALTHLSDLFDGKFIMSFGSMQLHVSDSEGDVQGVFVSSGNSGWIIAKIDPVSGVLRGDWVIPETATHYRTSGQIVFSPSDGGNKLVGSWKYDGTSAWHDTWVAVAQVSN